MNQLDLIGRAEKVDVLSLGLKDLPAKIDTGADSSSIWAGKVWLEGDRLNCIFFGPESPYYTGETVVFTNNFRLTRVANSFGHKELRYKVKLSIRVKGRLIRATFTLSDRSLKTYPLLLGRRLLKGKFLVDVNQGDALTRIERLKAKQLKQDLDNLKNKKEAL